MKPVKNLFLPILALLLPMLLLLEACNKERFTDSPDVRLQSSVDTLKFDTVFTTTGSITQFVKIFNDNPKGIHVSSIRLAGGSASPFHINVDGVPGPFVSGLDIAAEDSLYIFVTVSINPNAANLPFIVRDSIDVNYNGNKKTIQLEAFGQNAHFFRNRKITGTETWINDLPYVILGRLTVDTTATLNINKGCRIHMHADAPFIVHGTLHATGEKYDSTRIVFSGDRLDAPYRDYPAGYPGLIFSDASKGNTLQYVTVKNAYQGIVVTEPSPGIKLTMSETIIDNAYDAGLLAINTSINASNLLVSNCGKNIILAKGGNYVFTHCTSAAYSNSFIQHRDPGLLVTNYLSQNGLLVTSPLSATFRNCIFWGENNGLVENEVVVDKQGSTAFFAGFDQVLWRVQTNPSNTQLNGIINNQDPRFDSVNNSQRIYNFRLSQGSPALNKGVPAGVNIDLDGNPRPVGLPDPGAYERQ
jgi:hypothetical protein